MNMLLQATTAAPGWASLGVGGALAGFMFYFYRQDRKASEAQHIRSKAEVVEVLKQLHGDHTQLTLEFNSVVKSNTKAILELSHVLRTRPCLRENVDDIRSIVHDDPG